MLGPDLLFNNPSHGILVHAGRQFRPLVEEHQPGNALVVRFWGDDAGIAAQGFFVTTVDLKVQVPVRCRQVYVVEILFPLGNNFLFDLRMGASFFFPKATT